jgi:hypothetical protein
MDTRTSANPSIIDENSPNQEYNHQDMGKMIQNNQNNNQNNQLKEVNGNRKSTSKGDMIALLDPITDSTVPKPTDNTFHYNNTLLTCIDLNASGDIIKDSIYYKTIKSTSNTDMIDLQGPPSRPILIKSISNNNEITKETYINELLNTKET